MTLFINNDAGNLCGSECVNNELRGVLGEQNDVYALTSQLIGHGVHARAAHSDASALWVEARIVGFHGDLGAHSRIACNGLDFNDAFLNFWYFQLKECRYELRSRARQNQLGATRLTINAQHIGAHAVTHAEVFFRDQLIAWNDTFDAP